MENYLDVRSKRLLIFDLGNVIVDIDMNATVEAFRKFGVDGVERYVTESHSVGGIFTQFERGEVSDISMFNEIRRLSGISSLSDSQIRDAWNAMIGNLPTQRVRVIERLKKTHTVVLLSNTNITHKECFDSLAEGYDSLSDLFDKTWYSHEMHMNKPHSDIFLKVLEYHGVQASEAVFFDDSLMNVEAARKLGIESVHVRKGFDDISEFQFIC